MKIFLGMISAWCDLFKAKNVMSNWQFLPTAFTAIILLTGPIGCGQSIDRSSWHEKFDWRAEKYFKDPMVIALCKAIEADDLDEVDRLVADGADVKALGKDNMTPLLWAFPINKPEVFKRLLEHGADPNVIFQSDFNTRMTIRPGQSVTHLSCKVRLPKYFKYVFEHGADPNLVSSRELHHANGNHTPLFEVITGKGRDKKDRVHLLIEKGANLNHQDSAGDTPAMLAVGWGGQYDVALMLLKAGANSKLYRNDYSNTRLVHMVIGEERRLPQSPPLQKANYQKLVKWLEEHGESVEEARADIKRWRSWIGPPGYKAKMHRKEVADRNIREAWEKQDPKRRPQEDDSRANGNSTTESSDVRIANGDLETTTKASQPTMTLARWEKHGDMPTPLGRFALVSDGDVIYRLGGIDFNIKSGQSYGNEFWRYDPNTSAWRKLEAAPFGAGGALVAYWESQDKVVAVAGIEILGHQFHEDGAAVGIYDPDKNKWKMKYFGCRGLGRIETFVWIEGPRFFVISQEKHTAILDMEKGSLRIDGDYERIGQTISSARVGRSFYVLQSHRKQHQIFHFDLRRSISTRAIPFKQFESVWNDEIFALGDELYLWRNSASEDGGQLSQKSRYDHDTQIYGMNAHDGTADLIPSPPPTPKARRDAAGVLCSGYLYIMGGRRRTDQWLSDIHRMKARILQKVAPQDE